jgi:hypothetical protein
VREKRVAISSMLTRRRSRVASKIKATLCPQHAYLEHYLDDIDALIASRPGLSGQNTNWLNKLIMVIRKLHRQQSILIYDKTRSMPERIVNLV